MTERIVADVGDTDSERMPRRQRWARVVVGATAGLAWAGALRAWMAELSGPMSVVSWATFEAVLLPGLVVGAAVGWASSVGPAASARERRMLRWCAASPLAFAIAPMLQPGALVDFVTQGLGGGAVLVALTAIVGGWALGGGRPTWARIVCGILAFGISLVGALLTGPLVRGSTLALTLPRGAWIAVFDLALMCVLIAASSIPFRRLSALRSSALRSSALRSPALRSSAPRLPEDHG